MTVLGHTVLFDVIKSRCKYVSDHSDAVAYEPHLSCQVKLKLSDRNNSMSILDILSTFREFTSETRLIKMFML